MKKNSRRRLPALIAALVVLLAIAGSCVYFIPLVKVKNIEVHGATNADTAQVAEATGISVGENMLRVDSAAAAKNVASVPWVEKVTVSRSWPSTITVDVTEHQPVGYVKDKGTPLAVNEHGQVFLSGAQPEGAVEFRNVKADDAAAIEAAAQAVVALQPQVREQLEYMSVKNAESIELHFREDRTVFWGSADRAREKAEATRVVLLRDGAEWNVSNPAIPTLKS